MNFREKLGEAEYEKLLSDTSAHKGNNLRLKRALSKDIINVGFVGGSVTTGYSPAGMVERCYAILTQENIEKITHKKCVSLNLGIPGPTSFMGLTVAENGFKCFKPDIVFVEYAVNESLSTKGTQHFESLIRKLLSLDNEPAVILVIVFSEELYTCQEYMLYLAEHYNIGAIALMNAMLPLLEAKKLDWHDYCDDNVHPCADGQQFIADCIEHFLTEERSRQTDEAPYIPKPIFSSAYEALQLVDLKDGSVIKQGFAIKGYSCPTLTSSMDYVLESDKNSKECEIALSLVCRCVGIVYITDNNADRGDAEVFINGVHTTSLQGYSIFGWNNPIHKIVLDEEKAKLHNIRIVVKSGSGKAIFSVHAISYC